MPSDAERARPSVFRVMSAALRQAVETDPSDLEYLWRDAVIRRLSERIVAGGAWGFIRSFILFGWLAARDLVRQVLPHGRGRSRPERPALFCMTTRTELETLGPVASLVPAAWFTCINVHGRSTFEAERFDAEFPMGLAHLAALPFLPLVVYRWLTSTGWRRETYPRLFNVYWMSYGFAVVSVVWLHRYDPSALVVGGDHNTHETLLVRAARLLGIPTIYEQHACVTARFPPLVFDVSLLDGDDALHKYAAAGPSSTVAYLVGPTKLDSRRGERNTSTAVRTVGIATNLRDPFERVEELCAAIRGRLPDLTIVFRPRPAGSETAKWAALAERLGMELSTYQGEFTSTFLSRVDTLIGGDSSILLEAALLNVAPLYYDFSNERHDWYGFVERGLAPYAADGAAAVAILDDWARRKPDVRERTRYYSATVATPYDGSSAMLAANVIRRIADGVTEPGDPWELSPTPNVPFAVYRLRGTANAS